MVMLAHHLTGQRRPGTADFSQFALYGPAGSHRPSRVPPLWHRPSGTAPLAPPLWHRFSGTASLAPLLWRRPLAPSLPRCHRGDVTNGAHDGGADSFWIAIPAPMTRRRFLALASPELDIRAITVAGGNVGLDRTLANTLALTKLARSDVAVYRGADRPLLGSFVNEPRVHGIDGLGGIVLPEGGQPAAELAADAIRRILRTSPDR